MSEPVTIPSKRHISAASDAPTEPAVVDGLRARADARGSRETEGASGSSELELSDDDFVLLEGSRPAPISRSLVRAALAVAATPETRTGASPETRREVTPRSGSESRPESRPSGGLGASLPRLPMERDDASSSWDEESEVTDECLTAIAAEAARAARPSDPFLLVTPLARKSPSRLREHASAAPVRPPRLPPPLPATTARASRPSFSRVHAHLPPRVATPLEVDDPDEADTLPVPARGPAVGTRAGVPTTPCPFARTTADSAPPLLTVPGALARSTGGSITAFALQTSRDRRDRLLQRRPRAVWLLASAAAGALGAVAGMQVLEPSLRALDAAPRVVVTNAKPPSPARADADGAAPLDEGEGLEIGPPPPPAGPPPPPRRPTTGSTRPAPRPGGGQTARSPKQPRASAPAPSAKKRLTPEQALLDAQLRAVAR